MMSSIESRYYENNEDNEDNLERLIGFTLKDLYKNFNELIKLYEYEDFVNEEYLDEEYEEIEEDYNYELGDKKERIVMKISDLLNTILVYFHEISLNELKNVLIRYPDEFFVFLFLRGYDFLILIETRFGQNSLDDIFDWFVEAFNNIDYRIYDDLIDLYPDLYYSGDLLGRFLIDFLIHGKFINIGDYFGLDVNEKLEDGFYNFGKYIEKVNFLHIYNYIFKFAEILAKDDIISKDIFYRLKGYLTRDIEEKVYILLENFYYFLNNFNIFSDLLNNFKEDLDFDEIILNLYQFYIYIFFEVISSLYVINDFKTISEFNGDFFSVSFYLKSENDLFNLKFKTYLITDSFLKYMLISDKNNKNVKVITQNTKKNLIKNVDSSIEYLNYLWEKSKKVNKVKEENNEKNKKYEFSLGFSKFLYIFKYFECILNNKENKESCRDYIKRAFIQMYKFSFLKKFFEEKTFLNNPAELLGQYYYEYDEDQLEFLKEILNDNKLSDLYKVKKILYYKLLPKELINDLNKLIDYVFNNSKIEEIVDNHPIINNIIESFHKEIDNINFFNKDDKLDNIKVLKYVLKFFQYAKYFRNFVSEYMEFNDK